VTPLALQAGKFSGRATVMLKNIQQKAMEKAMAKKAAQNPGYAAAEASVGHGLHAE
jgi:hypothetical protein